MTDPNARDLILLSGGLDSSTLLAERVQAGTARLAVAFDYGQRHHRELDAAIAVAQHYGVRLIVISLRTWGRHLTGSALTDPDVAVPHGHYAAPSMKTTVVPNRNAVMLMAAYGIAVAQNLTHVLTAVHAGDHTIYPDCRPEFIDAINYTAQVGSGTDVLIEAPYVYITKTDIAYRGGQLGLPIGLTWSCYEGGDEHCGQCGTCCERAEALRDAGVPDPTVYRAVAA